MFCGARVICVPSSRTAAAPRVGSPDGVRDVLEPKSWATMPTTMPTRTVSTVSTVRTRRYGGSTLRYGLYGTKYLLATMPTTVPTTMPTTRTVSTVSTVRTLRYGGSTLRYGLYGTKYLLVLYGAVSKTPISLVPWYQACASWYEATTRYEYKLYMF